MKILRYYIDKLLGSVSARSLFPEAIIIDFYPEISRCCNLPLKVQKTRMKKNAVTLDIGPFVAREWVNKCQECGNIYTSQELKKLIPARCDFGYDVIAHIGKSLFLECNNEKEIQSDLKNRNISISRSEIAYLAKKFVVYLALSHKESSSRIKKTIKSRGGYILHVDGMCDGDSPHLMSGLDEISKLVLGNIKVPTEKAEKVIPFLEEIKKRFGKPLATVHDMGKGISNAVKKVFKNTLDFICHYHFLRDIGKDLFGKENDEIRKSLKKYGIQGLLRRQSEQNKKVIDNQPELIDSFVRVIGNGTTIPEWANSQTPQVAAYTIIQWALAGKKQGNGYGFPFDRLYLNFYQRLEQVNLLCEQLQEDDNKKAAKPFIKICRILKDTLKDKSLRASVVQMKEKSAVFDRLREAMRIAEPGGKKGLNDDGSDTDIKTIEKQVKDFRNWLTGEDCYKENKSYQKMIEQIDKYWEQLFADPITVDIPQGQITIQPQRTNNIIERFFRGIRYGYRRKSGNNSLNKTLKAMLADTPLVKNLKNPEYLKIILKGKATLAERFAEIDTKLVREEMKKTKEDSERIPAKIKAIIKEPDLPEIMKSLFARQLNS